MRLSSVGFVLALAIIAQSVAVPHSHVVHEKRGVTSSKWVQRGKLISSAILPMRVGLKQENLHRGHEFLMDVSHPESPNFAKHWTAEEVIEMFAPTEETVDAVRQWLVDFGIPSDRITHTDNQGWLAFDATAEDVEGLLHTEYHLYEDSSTGHMTAGCDSYHVPKAIQQHVDYITPGIKLLSAMNKGYAKRGSGSRIRIHGHSGPQQIKMDPSRFAGSIPVAGDLSTCDIGITPDCIRALYNVPVDLEYPNDVARFDNSLGIFEDGDYYAQEDLDLFFANFSSNIPQGTHPIPAFIDGATAPTDVNNAGGESDLDFQLAYPLIYPQNITLYQTDDSFYATIEIGSFNTFLDAIDGSFCTYSAYGETGDDPALDPVYPDPRPIGYQGQLECGLYKPTNVISISYGDQEIDLPVYYQQRQCDEYMKLGLKGTSIIFASGDDGVAGPANDPSYPTSNGCLGPNKTIFSPAFPNNCPYVTNVGATKIYPGQTVSQPESAVVDPAGQPYIRAFSSGGGFSNIFSQPQYQVAAVSSFLANYNPPYPYYEGNGLSGNLSGVYNRLGRGYPDVAANGDNIVVFNGGLTGRSGGTSASAPIFASIINRINEIRLNAGKNTLGFLNPALYQNSGMFNDVINGTNPGCGTVGFSAVPGWDPVTGLGTPNYPKMRDYLTGLP